MATAQDIIDVAESQIGCTDGAKYFNYFGVPDYGPWCVAYDRWVNAVANAPFGWYTWYAWDWSDAPDPISPHSLRKGDSISFDWDDDGGGDHVGIVKSVQDWGCVTVEGNTDWGRCAEKQRTWGVIICGIRPTLSDAEPEPTTIAVDGDCGHATIRAWQRQMGTDDDGTLSDQLWEHDKYRKAVTAIEHYHLDYADWAYQGSSLVKAVQSRLGISVDGDWGYNTTCAIQRQLKAWGYYTGRCDDGDFGYHSAECLQRSINDGKWK